MVRSFKFIIPLTDPPFWKKKVHGLKNWSPPGIEPGSLAWNAIALTARPRRRHSDLGRPKFKYPTGQPFNPFVLLPFLRRELRTITSRVPQLDLQMRFKYQYIN